MTRVRYLSIMNAVLVMILFVSIIIIGNEPAKNEVSISKNNQMYTYLESTEIEKKEEAKPDVKVEVKEEKKTNTVTPKVETKKEETKKVETKKQETKTEEKKEVQSTPKVDNNSNSSSNNNSNSNTTSTTNSNNTSSEKVLEKLVGGLAGYGPDCSGCSPYTATGKYIGNGNIYYEDKEYGKVRIVAGDKSFPFGTIVKITNTNYYNNAPIYAIVLDRGGIGRGKKFLFDLLFNSEKEASNMGSRQNVVFEILRLGY